MKTNLAKLSYQGNLPRATSGENYDPRAQVKTTLRKAQHSSSRIPKNNLQNKKPVKRPKSTKQKNAKLMKATLKTAYIIKNANQRIELKICEHHTLLLLSIPKNTTQLVIAH